MAVYPTSSSAFVLRLTRSPKSPATTRHPETREAGHDIHGLFRVCLLSISSHVPPIALFSINVTLNPCDVGGHPAPRPAPPAPANLPMRTLRALVNPDDRRTGHGQRSDLSRAVTLAVHPKAERLRRTPEPRDPESGARDGTWLLGSLDIECEYRAATLVN